MMESVKRGPELSPFARDRFATKLSELVSQFGDERVSKAIESCLDDSPFVPDISDVRKALGITSTQQAKADSDAVMVRAAEAWDEVTAYLRKYARRNEHGRWHMEPIVRIVFDNGMPVIIDDGKSSRIVKSERIPVPPLQRQKEWCLMQIGGAARVMETSLEYIEVVRRDFLRTWPQYGDPETPEVSGQLESPVDLRELLRESSEGARRIS